MAIKLGKTQVKAPKVRIDKAIIYFGSKKALSEAINCTPEAIYNWVREEKTYVPKATAYILAYHYPDLLS